MWVVPGGLLGANCFVRAGVWVLLAAHGEGWALAGAGPRANHPRCLDTPTYDGWHL